MFVPLNMLKPSVRLNAVLFVDSFCYYVSCVSLLRCLVCSLKPCDPLLGKG